MLVVARLFLIFLTPLVFLATSELLPLIVEKEALRWWAGVFGLAWIGVTWVLNKLADLAKIEGLAARERERLQDATAQIRRRLWWITAVCVIGGVGMFVLSVASSALGIASVALAAGAFVGIGLSYLVLVPFWYEELQRFIDSVRDREERRKELERALKDLPGSA